MNEYALAHVNAGAEMCVYDFYGYNIIKHVNWEK